jgi:hypothetical protein
MKMMFGLLWNHEHPAMQPIAIATGSESQALFRPVR